MVESRNIELDDFSVVLNVKYLQVAGDLLTSEVGLEVVKKDLQQFEHRRVEHDHGWNKENTHRFRQSKC